MRRLLITLASCTLLASLVGPAFASEPASHDVGVPATAAQTVEVTWTGTIAPGAENDSNCAGNPTADPHEIALTVPDGAYDDVLASMTATVAPTGPSADATDVVVTIVDPDDTATSGDASFVGAAESVSLQNPASGTYTVLACAFAGAVPQDYEGTLTVATTARNSDAPLTVCNAPAQGPKFEMEYIDTSRAGGEPIITRHPEGQLLWGSHAGTTHFYTPEAASTTTSAFVENYEGQTYYYVTEDGDDWSFVPRTPVQAAAPVQGVPGTGFSDPEFAIDQSGKVYVSEINLANVAVSSSTDGGRTYDLVNVFAFTSSDRQWMAADREDELYMTANGFGGGSFPASPVGNLGHFMAKSTDGGLTWGAASTTNPNGVGDIQIDHDRGILYEMSVTSDTISIARFPEIRDEDTDFTAEIFTIAENVSLSGVQRLIDPTFDMDSEGNLYATWTDNPPDDADGQGIFYAYSTDQGETWSPPQKVDLDAKDDVWPWITAGAPGNVAVTWLQSSESTGEQLGGEFGGDDAEWNVMVATSDTALGCADGEGAGFRVSQASSEPIHTGTICQHGTTCQTDLTDRRLGDYFSIETSSDGTLDIAVSDTRQGGAVALPLHIRQASGPTLGVPDPVDDGGTDGSADGDDSSSGAPDDGAADDDGGTDDDRGLAATGGGVGIAAALLAAAAVTRRRRD